MSNLKVSLCALLVLLISCARDRVNIISLEDLTGNPYRYDRSLIRVSGCYPKGFEYTVLRACATTWAENEIWIDPAEYVEEVSKVVTGRQERRTIPKAASAEDRKRYAALVALPYGSTVPVLIEGEFQTSPDGRFGMGHSHRIVLDRVLDLGKKRRLQPVYLHCPQSRLHVASRADRENHQRHRA
jgi:hypothetical protein